MTRDGEELQEKRMSLPGDKELARSSPAFMVVKDVREERNEERRETEQRQEERGEEAKKREIV